MPHRKKPQVQADSRTAVEAARNKRHTRKQKKDARVEMVAKQMSHLRDRDMA